jgi:hypothetical protein
VFFGKISSHGPIRDESEVTVYFDVMSGFHLIIITLPVEFPGRTVLAPCSERGFIVILPAIDDQRRVGTGSGSLVWRRRCVGLFRANEGNGSLRIRVERGDALRILRVNANRVPAVLAEKDLLKAFLLRGNDNGVDYPIAPDLALHPRSEPCRQADCIGVSSERRCSVK